MHEHTGKIKGESSLSCDSTAEKGASIMLYSIPDYYKEFHCVAGACEDTCCAGWQIVVDPKSLQKYKRVQGDFKNQLQKGLNRKKKVFRQDQEKRCAFLNEENLCEMYVHMGADSLCKTCRLYPRHVEEFESVREITLSLSCPEVARILMNRTRPVHFLTVEKEGEEEYEDFDPFLYSELLDARDVIRKILQNRSIPLEVRQGLVYGIAHDMQHRADRRELFSCGEVLEKYQKDSAVKFVSGRVKSNSNDWEKQFDFAKKMFRYLHKLELLKEDWEYLLLETEEQLYLDHTAGEYHKISEEFDDWTKENHYPWEIQKEQLLVYFIDTYFCGAVYDGQVLPKAQMALICTDLLEELVKTRWICNEKTLDTEDVIEIVYRFSREIEHSDRNLKRIEEMMPKLHARYC